MVSEYKRRSEIMEDDITKVRVYLSDAWVVGSKNEQQKDMCLTKIGLSTQF